MFGRHPRIPVDLVLGCQQEAVTRSVDSYVATLRQRLQEAYEQATSVTRDSQAGQKKGYDCKVRRTILCEGDRVLVKGKDIHPVPIDVSDMESVGSGMDSSISDASDIPDLRVPIPAPRRILRNVPVATPRLSNVVPLDMSDSSDSVLSFGNEAISAGSERSISDIEQVMGNVDIE